MSICRFFLLFVFFLVLILNHWKILENIIFKVTAQSVFLH